MKSPHSIIVPTLLKSVSVAWRNKGVRGVWKGGENTALKEMDGAKEEEKSKGRRVMEIGSEWASKVPGGHS